MSKDNFDDKKLEKGIEYSLLQDVLTDLKRVDESMDQSINSKTKDISFWASPLKLAAVLVPLVIISGLVIFQILNRPANKDVPYFEPFENDFVVKTRSREIVKSLEARAFEAYDAGNFDSAEELFIDLLGADYKNKSLVQLFLANSLLAQGKSEEAIDVLDELLLDPGVFRHEAQWYLAISVLDQGDSLKTRQLLQSVAIENDSFSDEAKSLLRLF